VNLTVAYIPGVAAVANAVSAVALTQFLGRYIDGACSEPASTRALIVLGQVVGAAMPWLLVLGLVAAVAVPRLLAVPALRLKLDRLLLRLPLVGRLLRETVAARMTRTLGTLLQNGVPLIPALAVVKDALGNLAASAAVEAASIEAKGGRGLARPLAEAEQPASVRVPANRHRTRRFMRILSGDGCREMPWTF